MPSSGYTRRHSRTGAPGGRWPGRTHAPRSWEAILDDPRAGGITAEGDHGRAPARGPRQAGTGAAIPGWRAGRARRRGCGADGRAARHPHEDGNLRVTSYAAVARPRSGDLVRLAEDARSAASLDAAHRPAARRARRALSDRRAIVKAAGGTPPRHRPCRLDWKPPEPFVQPPAQPPQSISPYYFLSEVMRLLARHGIGARPMEPSRQRHSRLSDGCSCHSASCRMSSPATEAKVPAASAS